MMSKSYNEYSIKKSIVLETAICTCHNAIAVHSYLFAKPHSDDIQQNKT